MRSTLFALLAALALPAAAGAFVVTQAAGTLTGQGTTPSHDFPVSAERFDITISEPDATGTRAIEVRVPVLAISTDNGGRDGHMRRTVFAGFDEPGKGEVVFQARTAQPLAPGEVALEGRLSILGQARPVTVNATLSGTTPLRAVGTATVDLEQWGIDTPGYGPMKVSPLVRMGFDVALPGGGGDVSALD